MFELKDEGYPLEWKGDPALEAGHLEGTVDGVTCIEGVEESSMAAAVKQMGICYEYAFNHKCGKGTSCQYSHREDDITRMRQKVAYDCSRFFQKEMQEALNSGDLVRCKVVLEEINKVGKEFPPVNSQRKE